MNKLYKILVGIFITGIGIINMCNAGKITYNGVAEQYKRNATNFGPLILNSRGGPIDYECCFSNFSGTSSFDNKTINLQFKKNGDSAYTTIKSFNSSVIINNECVNGTYNGNYMTDSFYMTLYFPYVGTLNSYNTTYSCSFSGDAIFVEEDTNYYLSSYLSLLTGDNNGTTCDTGTILSGYILESSINTAYCTGNNLCPTCEECQQCQTCPTIDAQYCMNNFNLIPPAYCPICGTGDVNWSSLYINGTQYNSNEMIDIHTENQMDIDIDYLNDTVDIDISYGQDEEYLNNILSGTAMTPTKEDFSTMLSDGLIAYAPYLFIGLLIIFTIGLIKKFFRG